MLHAVVIFLITCRTWKNQGRRQTEGMKQLHYEELPNKLGLSSLFRKGKLRGSELKCNLSALEGK